jgi:hypothetical protein
MKDFYQRLLPQKQPYVTSDRAASRQRAQAVVGTTESGYLTGIGSRLGLG